MDLKEAAKLLGRQGGMSTSKRKRLASAKNGKKGGRPRKQAEAQPTQSLGSGR